MRLAHYVFATPILCGSVTSFAAERACPKTILNSYQCSQFLEAELGKDYPALFSRSGPKLVVALTNGGNKKYIDIPDEKNSGAEGRWFNFVQYYPEIGYGLIAVQHYEGGAYYFTNLRTGKDTEISARPVVSPDRKRIAVANADLESRYTPNILSVHELRPTGLVPEFVEKPDDWGAGKLRWVTNQEISFIRFSLNPSFNPMEPDKYLLEVPKVLRYRGASTKEAAKWSIE